MKHLKQFLLFALLIPCSVWADDDVYSGTCGEEVTWAYDATLKRLTIGGTGDITSSPWQDYSYKTEIEELVVGAGVKKMNGSFYGCTGLKNVILGSGVNHIGGSFEGCSSLENFTMLGVLGEYEGIGSRMFYGCTSLTTFAVPAGAVEIGEKAFYGCTSLTSITFPDGMRTIGSNAFTG